MVHNRLIDRLATGSGQSWSHILSCAHFIPLRRTSTQGEVIQGELSLKLCRLCGSRAQAGRGLWGGANWLTGQTLASQLPARLLLLLDAGRVQIGKWRLTKQEVQIVQRYEERSEELRFRPKKAMRSQMLDRSLEGLKKRSVIYICIYFWGECWLSGEMQCGIECIFDTFSKQPLGPMPHVQWIVVVLWLE